MLTISEYLDAANAEAVVACADDLLKGVAPVGSRLVEILHAIDAELMRRERAGRGSEESES